MAAGRELQEGALCAVHQVQPLRPRSSRLASPKLPVRSHSLDVAARAVILPGRSLGDFEVVSLRHRAARRRVPLTAGGLRQVGPRESRRLGCAAGDWLKGPRLQGGRGQPRRRHSDGSGRKPGAEAGGRGGEVAAGPCWEDAGSPLRNGLSADSRVVSPTPSVHCLLAALFLPVVLSALLSGKILVDHRAARRGVSGC